MSDSEKGGVLTAGAGGVGHDPGVGEETRSKGGLDRTSELWIFFPKPNRRPLAGVKQARGMLYFLF